MGAASSIAVVVPRHADGATAGGAETLLRQLALRCAGRGLRVRLLTTCAKSHFTWANERPAGVVRDGPIEVEYFPVDDRDAGVFLEHQQAMGRGAELTRAQEEAWLANSVHSRALYEHLRTADYDRVLAGPYLFGLTVGAARVRPEKTLLVPCLHDEPFAYVSLIREMFGAVRGCLFNSEPERDLAARICGLPAARGRVVGMGIEPFDADPAAFAARRGIDAPYVLYSGRREAAKGVPMLAEYVRVFRERTGRDVRLVMTGSGPVDPHPFVLDAGMLPEAEKREAMVGARVFCHPSRLESLGIVLLEAFMAGTPALVNEGSEVLQWQCRRSGAGLGFRHYPDFEAMLDRLLADEPLRARMGAQGRRFVQAEYSWPAVDARLFQALETL
jgi:glycosyltransferase involved in cell wall biosynthesis